MLFTLVTTALATTAMDEEPCFQIHDIHECAAANKEHGCRWVAINPQDPDDGFCDKTRQIDWPNCPEIVDKDECGAEEVCEWRIDDEYTSCTFNVAADEKLCTMSKNEESCFENPGSCFWNEQQVCECVSCKGDRNFCELISLVREPFPFRAMMQCMGSECKSDKAATDLCMRSFPETPQDAADACDKQRCDCIGGFTDPDGFCIVSQDVDEPHPCISCRECSDPDKLKCNAERAICFHAATQFQVSPTLCSNVFECMKNIPDLREVCKSHRDVSICSPEHQDIVCPAHEVLHEALMRSLDPLN